METIYPVQETGIFIGGSISNVISYFTKGVGNIMPGIRIDGNDPLDVYLTAQQGVERARQGEGPTLIECMTYRWRGHVGPNYDIDKGLRSREELETWMDRCPVSAMENLLRRENVVSKAALEKISSDMDAEIEAALAFAKASPFPSVDDLTSNVFAP